MEEKIKQINLQNGVNLHFLNSDKFKSIIMGVYIKRPLKKEEVALNALLSRIIDQSTAIYPEITALNKAVEDLYGATLVTDVHKYGEKQVVQLKLNVVLENLVGEDHLTEDAVKLIREVLLNPKVVEGGFEPQIFNAAKESLISEIEMRIEDKGSWTIARCIENMYRGEPYAIHEYGEVSDIEAISSDELLRHFYHIMKTSEIDIIVHGKTDHDIIEQYFRKHLVFPREIIEPIPAEKWEYDPQRVKTYHEYAKMEQARLVLGYHLNIEQNDPLYNAATIGSIILGYGGSSKLFKNVREKESLCYSVFSRMERYKSLLMIYAGIDYDNYNKALEMIKIEVENLKNGEFSDEDVTVAISNYISSLESVLDYPNAYTNYYYNQYLSKDELSITKNIEDIKSVTREDVIVSLKHLVLDTVMLLSKEQMDA